MKSRLRKSFIAGVALVLLALLVMAVTFLYVVFAPRVFWSEAAVMVTFGSPKGRSARLDELPLQLFNQERNLTFSQAKGTPVIKIDAFAMDPEMAAARANQCVEDLGKAVRSQMQAQFSIVAPAVPYPHPVRPAKQKILVTSGIAALNLVIAGVTCLVIASFKGRGELAAEQVPLQATP